MRPLKDAQAEVLGVLSPLPAARVAIGEAQGLVPAGPTVHVTRPVPHEIVPEPPPRKPSAPDSGVDPDCNAEVRRLAHRLLAT